MLKILQARLQQDMNHELPDVQARFRKGRETRQQIANIHSVQFSQSVVCDSLQPYGLQPTGLPAHHQLLEFTQTHAHCISDAIQLFNPLLSPSSPTFNLSQQHGLFQ